MLVGFQEILSSKCAVHFGVKKNDINHNDEQSQFLLFLHEGANVFFLNARHNGFTNN